MTDIRPTENQRQKGMGPIVCQLFRYEIQALIPVLKKRWTFFQTELNYDPQEVTAQG